MTLLGSKKGFEPAPSTQWCIKLHSYQQVMLCRGFDGFDRLLRPSASPERQLAGDAASEHTAPARCSGYLWARLARNRMLATCCSVDCCMQARQMKSMKGNPLAPSDPRKERA